MALFSYSELRNSYASKTYDMEAYDSLYESKQFNSADSIYISEYDEFDIFLSHSYKDRAVIPYLKKELEGLGYKVYVDWINDRLLSRENVTSKTAEVLQKRMKQSKSLIFATSENSPNSKWMPWELGYFDALKNKRVAILPLKHDNNFTENFKGQEYLGLYFWIDKSKVSNSNKIDLFVNGNNSEYVIFKNWLDGYDPYMH